MSSNHTPRKSGWLHKTSHKVIALAAATVITLGGVLGAQSFAGSKTAAHLKLMSSSDDVLVHRASWRRDRHDDFFEMSDAEIDAKLTRVIKHVAIEIDATQTQQDRIISLVTSAVKQVKPMRDIFRDTGKRIHSLLLANTVDHAALETLRAERLADSERISKTLIRTLADVAEVLSPEQRMMLNERIGEMRSKRKD